MADTFTPDPPAVATYDELIDTYAALPDQLDQPFRQIHSQGL